MLFNSFDFVLFFIVVMLLQWQLPHRPRNIMLLGASYFFYGAWDWRFLFLIWLSTIIDWFCGQKIFNAKQQGNDPLARRVVTFSVICNLSILGVFKYAGFFVGSMADLLNGLGLNVPLWQLNIVLPVGISFYTFQTISYSVDIYRGDVKPANKFSDFALFVAFFPQLVAGPIEKAKKLLPQLSSKPVVSPWQIKLGAWLVLWGLFKKVGIADNVAPIVNTAFADPNISGGDLWIALIAFSIQIYCDFSGYTDIARGVAKMMGYELTVNFRLPYLANSPADHLRRWHISLTSWFRDYVYIPLGGNRKGANRAAANSMTVMLLSGLWHGAAWNYVLWGAYHGALLVLQQLFKPIIHGWGITLSPWQSRWMTYLRVFITFNLVCYSWVVFRAESPGQSWQLTVALFSDFHFTEQAGYWSWQLLAFSWPLLLVQWLQMRSADLSAPLRLPLVMRATLYTVILVSLLLFGNLGGRQFIYFQF